MTEDDFFTLSLHPAHISGVHNYCDRWCERCPFADRCVVNATARQMRGDAPPPEPDALVEHLKMRFASARASIDRRWTGWQLPDDAFIATRDPVEELKEEQRRERIEAHPMLREAMAYASLVDAWLDTEAATLKACADQLAERADTDDLETLTAPSTMDRVVDALLIVQHDAVLIGPKLYRALDGRSDFLVERGPFDDPVQTDFNGSAKVVLLSLDRSESAWRIIHRWCPASGTAMLLAEHLCAIRTMTEREFPDARRFLRVGFDGLRSG